jgi:hypothetical protein
MDNETLAKAHEKMEQTILKVTEELADPSRPLEPDDWKLGMVLLGVGVVKQELPGAPDSDEASIHYEVAEEFINRIVKVAKQEGSTELMDIAAEFAYEITVGDKGEQLRDRIKGERSEAEPPKPTPPLAPPTRKPEPKSPKIQVASPDIEPTDAEVEVEAERLYNMMADCDWDEAGKTDKENYRIMAKRSMMEARKD